MFCNEFTYSSLKDDLDFSSKSTLQKFCNYLQQTYLFFYLPRYNNKLKLMQKAPQKVYVVDNGFLASNAFQTTENKGRLLENLVFLELPRRKNKVGDNLFYYHSRNDRETDFLLPTPLPKFGKTDRYFYRNYLPNAFQEIGTHFFVPTFAP